MITKVVGAVRTFGVALAVLGATVCLKGQAPGPTALAVGSVPRRLQVHSWVRGTEKPTWETLRGRVVVRPLSRPPGSQAIERHQWHRPHEASDRHQCVTRRWNASASEVPIVYKEELRVQDPRTTATDPL